MPAISLALEQPHAILQFQPLLFNSQSRLFRDIYEIGASAGTSCGQCKQ